jgi:Uncharacterized conserved protein
MKTINENTSYKIIINKSKFICKLYKVNDENEIKSILNDLKIEYKDATHICYGYRLINKEKCSDDGEPSGTAGLPILNILEANALINVLCTVIRYFGGVKLGSGGLIRAYSNCAKEGINHSSIFEIVEGYEIKIEFSYENVKQIDYLLKNTEIVLKEFLDSIIYTIKIEKDNYDGFIKQINNTCLNYKIIKRCYIRKY